jgi:hypothetical protein
LVTRLLHEVVGYERVLVVLEPGAAGTAVIKRARELAEGEGAAITVVGIARQARSTRGRCGYSAADYNEAVADAIAEELERARTRLGDLGEHATLEVLIDTGDDVLARWSALTAFDVVLLPARRRRVRTPRHPAAAALMQTGADVRVIDAQGRQLPIA